MCGRFTQKLTWREIHDLYSSKEPEPPPKVQARYNGAPGQDFAACRLDEKGNRVVGLLRWGLVPYWAKDLGSASRIINARSETVHQKPSFRAAFRSRRCLVPADGWFEWKRAGGVKQPYFLRLAGRSPLSFAALWERWEKSGEVLESFTIITTKASAELVHIHHRQPAILDPNQFDDWLDPASPTPRLLDLVRSSHAGPFEQRVVSARVNSVRNDDPELLRERRITTDEGAHGRELGIRN
ncbi:MAG: hypothetical protein F7B06_07885 [Opitutae bacterium]|nr:hypothetical protein [Opitutae bacterium]MBC9889756.1 hypothetical protein [Opitutae bacterium]